MSQTPQPFILDLEFELNFQPLSTSGSLPVGELAKGDLQAAYGEFWKQYWLNFIGTICHPGTPDPQPVRVPAEALMAMAGDDDDFEDEDRPLSSEEQWPYQFSQISQANAYQPITGGNWEPTSQVDELRLLDLVDPIPAERFIASLGPAWSHHSVGKFAEAFGYFADGEGGVEYGRLVSFEMLSLDVREGSLWAKAKVKLVFLNTALLLPLAVIACTSPINQAIGEYQARTSIEEVLRHEHLLCKVEGSLTYDRKELIARLEKRMLHPDGGVCEIQAALTALGFSTGAIDGKMGVQTSAAIAAFGERYKISAEAFHPHVTPVFVNVLANALTGAKAPA